jgi:hypothetical protein
VTAQLQPSAKAPAKAKTERGPAAPPAPAARPQPAEPAKEASIYWGNKVAFIVWLGSACVLALLLLYQLLAALMHWLVRLAG